MTIKYCIECAAPLVRQTDTHYSCANGHDFWNNPKAAVGVVLMKDGKILLSKRAHEPAKGLYDLPGGFIEFGEDAFIAAIREIDEETGLKLKLASLTLLTAYTGPYWENESVCDLIVLARNWSGEPVAADDSEALEWHDLSFLDSPQFNPPYPDLNTILESIEL